MTTNPNANNHAGWEHLFQSGFFPPRYKTFAEPNGTVVEWADTLLPSGTSILDLGCGVGRHAIYLGKRGFKIAGADISPSAVKQTQAACDERQIDFDGRVADMTSLPWDDSSFDAALSTSTVCHHTLANIQKTLAEVQRVLKPNGSFLVDFLHKDTLAYQGMLKQVAEGSLSEVEPNTFVDMSPQPDVNDDAFLPHHYCDEAEVRDLVQDFEIVKLYADLSDKKAEDSLARRGYWVAWLRKA